MEKIEHIGIAVEDIEKANLLFKAILGKTHYKTEYVESEDVLTSFFDLGESKLELIESCLLYTSPSPRDLSTSRMPSSA